MPFTIVVVTPLIAIMKDLVEHLNKVGVVATMMGEDVDEAVKSGSCEICMILKNSLIGVLQSQIVVV